MGVLAVSIYKNEIKCDGKKKEEQNVELIDSDDEEFTFEKESIVLRGKTVSAWEALDRLLLHFVV